MPINHIKTSTIADGTNTNLVLHSAVQLRNQETQQFMVQFYKDAATDIIATLIKK